jgi:hypothetical protein
MKDIAIIFLSISLFLAVGAPMTGCVNSEDSEAADAAASVEETTDVVSDSTEQEGSSDAVEDSLSDVRENDDVGTEEESSSDADNGADDSEESTDENDSTE